MNDSLDHYDRRDSPFNHTSREHELADLVWDDRRPAGQMTRKVTTGSMCIKLAEERDLYRISLQSSIPQKSSRNGKFVVVNMAAQPARQVIKLVKGISKSKVVKVSGPTLLSAII